MEIPNKHCEDVPQAEMNRMEKCCEQRKRLIYQIQSCINYYDLRTICCRFKAVDLMLI